MRSPLLFSGHVCLSLLAAVLVLVSLAATSAEATLQVLPAAPMLQAVGATPFEMVVSWSPVPGAVGYVVERSLTPDFPGNSTHAYHLPPALTVYGDTGETEGPGPRFRPPFQDLRAPSLPAALPFSRGTFYYYRLTATLPNAQVVVSNTVAMQVAGPVRGQAGDLWADVVLGQQDFSSYTYLYPPTMATAELPGGLAVDGDRVYLVDVGRNRILTLQKELSGQLTATGRLGQTDPGGAACNGGGTLPNYPDGPPASATSLCYTRPGEISPFEAVAHVNPTVDAYGNLYVPDPQNNRVLEYRHPSATDGVADEVWGQGGDFTTRTCNKGGRSASSLCLDQFTSITGVDVDRSTGDLWVADTGNHRVLRFPYVPPPRDAPSQTADFVLGQPDFMSGEQSYHDPGCENACRDGCNQGPACIDYAACLAPCQGLTDTCNACIQDCSSLPPEDFFPCFLATCADPCTAASSCTAPCDQGDSYRECNECRNSCWGRCGITTTTTPVAVRVAPSTGDVYVLAGLTGEPGSLTVYRAADIAHAHALGQISAGGTTVVTTLPDSARADWAPTGLAVDRVRNGLWIQSSLTANSYFYDLNLTPERITKILAAQFDPRGIDVDSAGNVFVVTAWGPDAVSAFPAQSVDAATTAPPLLAWTDLNRQAVFANVLSPGAAEWQTLTGLAGVTGMAIAGNQLIVSDPGRLLFWNDYHLLSSGKRADGSWDYHGTNSNMASPRVDTSGRLWVSNLRPLVNAPGDACGAACIRAFSQLPLTSNTTSDRAFSVAALNTTDPQQSINPTYQDFIRFVPIGDGDRMWVATVDRGVLRVVNINGTKAGGPYVDVVLGRTSLTDPDGCVGSSAPASAQRICEAVDVRVDPTGNVWVVSKVHSVDGLGTSLLEFAAADIPDSPGSTQFGIAAAAIYGTNGSFGNVFDFGYDLCPGEAGCQPFPPAFDKAGHMVIGTNPYTNSRFPLIYTSYADVPLPQLALGDWTSYITDSLFDREGNLYLGDWDFNRILIYWKPFGRFFHPDTKADVGRLTLVDRSTSNSPLAHKITLSRTYSPTSWAEMALPERGSAGDPTASGATGGGAVLTVYNTAGKPNQAIISLPAAGWSALGGTTGTKTPSFMYKDPRQTFGPITKASISSKRTPFGFRVAHISVTGRGAAWGAAWPYHLDNPTQGTIAARLTLGTGAESCTVFAGTRDQRDFFTGKPSNPRASCPPGP